MTRCDYCGLDGATQTTACWWFGAWGEDWTFHPDCVTYGFGIPPHESSDVMVCALEESLAVGAPLGVARRVELSAEYRAAKARDDEWRRRHDAIRGDMDYINQRLDAARAAVRP